MARTHKDRLKMIQNNYYTRRDWYLKLSRFDQVKVDNWYKQTPSWWNHLFSTTRRRREERDLLRKVDIVTKGYSILWPLDKKPHIYYY